jgi:predicted phage-related endonuclease
MLASPDGLFEDGSLAELKSTTTRNDQLGEEGTDEIPAEWLLQCQQQMAVCDAQRVHVMVMYRDKVPLGWLLETYGELVGGGNPDLSDVDSVGWAVRYVVERNDRLIESMVKREREFWRHVIDRTPPPLDFEHTHAARAVRNAFREVSNGKTVELSPELEDLWAKYQELGEAEKEAKKAREAITARVLMELKDAETGVLPSGAQLRRTLVAGGHVSYDRKPYVRLSYRKAK